MKVLLIIFTVALPSAVAFRSKDRNLTSPLIVGGQNAIPHSAPYIVSIQLAADRSGHFCGGSILTVNWVLSAAHCMWEGEQMIVIAGEHDFRQNTGREQTRLVAEFINHEEYDDWELYNDICVMRLASPFTLVPGIVEATRLPPPGRTHTGQVTLFGWGGTSRTAVQVWPDILQTTTKPLLTIPVCQEIMNSIFTGMRPLYLEICSGPLNGQTAACFGDSGGPLVQSVNGQIEQIGIVSWGPGSLCAMVNSPIVYAQVSGYIDWIARHIHA